MKKNLKELIFERTIRLAVPSLIWAGVAYAVNIIIGIKSFSFSLLPVELTTGGAWFCWLIIILNAVVVVCVRKFYKRYVPILILFGILTLFMNEFLPNIQILAYLFFPYIIGFIINEKKVMISNMVIGIMAVLYIVFLFSIGVNFYNSYGSFRILSSEFGMQKQILINIYTYLLMFGGICLFIIIANFFFDAKNSKINDIICNMGRHSLQIYLLHSLINGVIALIQPYVNRESFFQVLLIQMLIAPILTFGVCNVISWFSQKLYMNNPKLSLWLFGR